MKSGGALFFKSNKIPIDPESFLPPPADPPYADKIVSKIVSQEVVRYPISAFGWSPNKIGDSIGNFVSIYYLYPS